MRSVAVFLLLTAIPVPATLQGQRWFDLGVAAGGGRSACRIRCFTGQAFIQWNARAGVYVSPRVALGATAEFGHQYNYVDQAPGRYTILAGIAEFSPAKALRLRGGAGWASSDFDSSQGGDGLVARLGASVKLPPRSIIAVTINGDYTAGVAGHVTDFTGGTGPFRFHVFMVGASVRYGDGDR